MIDVVVNDPAFTENLPTWVQEALDELTEHFGPASNYNIHWHQKPSVKLMREFNGKEQLIEIQFRVERDAYDIRKAEYVFHKVFVGGKRTNFGRAGRKGAKDAAPKKRGGRPKKAAEPTPEPEA